MTLKNFNDAHQSCLDVAMHYLFYIPFLNELLCSIGLALFHFFIYELELSG